MLALVACIDPKDGPWYDPRGNEIGVRVTPELVVGEYVVVQYELSSSEDAEVSIVSGGYHPLPQLASCKRYRARKLGSGTPTTVEILTNGKAQRSPRNSNNSERPE